MILWHGSRLTNFVGILSQGYDSCSNKINDHWKRDLYVWLETLAKILWHGSEIVYQEQSMHLEIVRN